MVTNLGLLCLDGVELLLLLLDLGEQLLLPLPHLHLHPPPLLLPGPATSRDTDSSENIMKIEIIFNFSCELRVVFILPNLALGSIFEG